MSGKILSVFVTNLGKYTEGGCYVALVDTPVEYTQEKIYRSYTVVVWLHDTEWWCGDTEGKSELGIFFTLSVCPTFF